MILSSIHCKILYTVLTCYYRRIPIKQLINILLSRLTMKTGFIFKCSPRTFRFQISVCWSDHSRCSLDKTIGALHGWEIISSRLEYIFKCCILLMEGRTTELMSLVVTWIHGTSIKAGDKLLGGNLGGIQSNLIHNTILLESTEKYTWSCVHIWIWSNQDWKMS